MKYVSITLNLILVAFLVMAAIKWQGMERAAIHNRCATYDESNQFKWLDDNQGMVLLTDPVLPPRKPKQ